MKEPQFTRTNHVIRNEETREREVFKSVNKAKRWSREMQIKLDGALGRGSVRVE